MLSRLRTKGYIVAYKHREDGCAVYTAIPNDNGSYAADPFVFEDGGIIYIFAEIYIYTKDKGSLGYCRIIDGKPTHWKVVIEEDYHLSYPNIFRMNHEIYICPESSQNNSVYYYKAIQFPDKWEKCETIINDMSCVDTTFLKTEDQIYGFTLRIDHHLHDLLLFRINEGKVEFSKANPISTDPASARLGGKILKENGMFIRVSQDCTPYYGHGVVFSEMDLNWPYYSEKMIRKMYPEDITISINRKFKKIGIHTYNRNNELEVIDLQITNMSLYTLFWRVKHKVCKTLLKW